MSLLLKKNNIDISVSIDWTTLQKTEVLTKEVDRLEFDIKKTPTKTIPSVGDTIELYEDSEKIFGGIMVERNEKVLGGVLLGYECKCKDWSHQLDGKLVVKQYTDENPHDIVADIISMYTTGFTVSNVKPGGLDVASITFNYEQVSRALTQLADQIGWDWYVDPDKDIHFFDEETSIAPFNLDDTSGNFEWKTLEINQTVVNLKNYIFVRGGDYTRSYDAGNTVDVYKADGTQVLFPLAYKYDNITIDKNGSAQTVGVDQKDDPASVQVLYNFNEKFVRFTTPPSSGDIIKIYGDANIPIIASVRDQISVATYGEFQQAIIDKSIQSVAEAQSRAKAELKKYSSNVNEGRFKTTKTGLKTGQSITVTSAIRNIDKQFKITRIVGKARGSDHMEYEIFLLASGQVTFTDIMVELLTKDKKNIDIAQNEVLQILESFFESVEMGEVVTITGASRPYTWGLGGANDARFNFATWG
jgi:hypothetical protein